MSKLFTALPLSAALFVLAPLPVLAQDTTATTEEAKPEAAQGSKVEEQLSLGEDASGDPELGKPYTQEVIGEWEMRCIKTEAEIDPCQMYQLLDDGQGAPVAEISLFRLPDGGKAKAGATIVVPLETSLPQQLTISVDGGKARRYPYAFCNPVGCYARLGLTDADISAFKRGKAAEITIIPALAPDQKVKLALSLSGFTASYNKVSVIDQ
ncbi:invasion associated locus B family protein [Sulfitobacter sp. M57]|uniref:invasion associated locus B family protein n=1 Tax=unclassified Sulfitobacter TaxID=196795 RepID=UPI0023E23322|nr:MULTISPECIES: invasion associated locus B family protein [unclassified Sulfitobacter]MDF3413820.1 invasion associated locus B family protein [Sulfitobacter sp. KE5]MDF3420899.1 invasion associated locus B family protein [Sulfitobacter sp. KE43]MDF3432366.1 invasion associated locus B family protein [Sulfitobacter sp. KE42]MDF3458005.1 invasion associated locus B family protein [Sulfitobacter sp. S74]MDF3461906.1 invasion associated locus B family protein [Sulfitobacter sp. Ks18]